MDRSLPAIALAESVNDLPAEVASRFWVAFALRDMGDLEGSSLQAAANMAPAEKLHDRFWLASALWCNNQVNRLGG